MLNILLISFLLLPTAQGNDNNCVKCHRERGDVDIKVLNLSAHSALSCQDCHLNLSGFPHKEDLPKVYCGMCHKKEEAIYKESVHRYAFYRAVEKSVECTDCHGNHNILPKENPNSLVIRDNIPKTCSRCHSREYKEYSESIHWQAFSGGSDDAPVCIDCHRGHAILSPSDTASTIHPANIPTTCTSCHEDVRITSRYSLPAKRLETYLSSYHGIVLSSGVITAANCASCHEAHRILPSWDSNSSTYIENLPTTCGKCHPGASPIFVQGKIHVEPKKSVSPGVFYVRLFYTIFIGTLLFFFIVHIIFDIRKRFRKV